MLNKDNSKAQENDNGKEENKSADQMNPGNPMMHWDLKLKDGRVH